MNTFQNKLSKKHRKKKRINLWPIIVFARSGLINEVFGGSCFKFNFGATPSSEGTDVVPNAFSAQFFEVNSTILLSELIL